MNSLELTFGEVISSILKEMMSGDAQTFAINAGDQAYYIDQVLKEVQNKTHIGDQFAKSIIGIAVEMAIRDKEQHSHIEAARKSADHLVKKYLKYQLPDCVK